MLQLNDLHKGTLLKRYKRFLADVQLDSGEVIVAHCPNPGSMLGCCPEGSTVYLAHSADLKRKLPYTWTLIDIDGTLVNVNTMLPNTVVYNAIAAGQMPELSGYASLRKEVPFGDSRFDLFLSDLNRPDCFVEIKSTTLCEAGKAMFPDAVTVRGRKHLETLTEVVRQGKRAVQFYLISRFDAHTFSPADHIDPQYGKALRLAHQAGVEVLAYKLEISCLNGQAILKIAEKLPISF